MGPGLHDNMEGPMSVANRTSLLRVLKPLHTNELGEPIPFFHSIFEGLRTANGMEMETVTN